MTEAQTKRLREKLEAKCKKHVELTVQTDPTLLGGIRLELPTGSSTAAYRAT